MSTEQNHIVLGKGDLTLDAWGHQIVSQRISLFHGLFTFDIPPKVFRLIVDGGDVNLIGATEAVSTNGKLVLITDGVNGSYVLLESHRQPRYQPNRSHAYSASVGIPTPVSAAIQDFGLFTDTNGVFFRCGVDGELYACIMSGGVLTHSEKITLPDNFPDNFDISKGQNYDIQFQWRGIGSYFFYIENAKTRTSQLVHTIEFLGKTDGVSIENPALPAAYRVTSLGAADGLWSGCVDITSSGGTTDRLQHTSSISNPVICSTNTPILVVKQPPLINGEINTRDIRIVRIHVLPDKKATVNLWLTRDPTAIVGGVYNVIGNGSYLEENKTAISVDITKMSKFLPIKGVAGVHAMINNPEPDVIDFYIVHGEYLVLTGTGASVSIEVVVEFGEEI